MATHSEFEDGWLKGLHHHWRSCECDHALGTLVGLACEQVAEVLALQRAKCPTDTRTRLEVGGGPQTLGPAQNGQPTPACIRRMHKPRTRNISVPAA